MAIDLSKAFDMVNHNKLIATFNTHNHLHNTLQWLFGYPRGRIACYRYGDTTSSKPFVRAIVSQAPASLQSSSIFRLYVPTGHSTHCQLLESINGLTNEVKSSQFSYPRSTFDALFSFNQNEESICHTSWT